MMRFEFQDSNKKRNWLARNYPPPPEGMSSTHHAVGKALAHAVESFFGGGMGAEVVDWHGKTNIGVWRLRQNVSEV